MKNIIPTTVIASMLITGLTSIAGNATASRVDEVFEDKEAICLALNVYYEARGSNLADKAAVADVVLNRTLDRRYPATICGVVQDGYKPGRSDCQFSWYCDGRADVPQDMDSWYEAQTIAYSMLADDQYRCFRAKKGLECKTGRCE